MKILITTEVYDKLTTQEKRLFCAALSQVEKERRFPSIEPKQKGPLSGVFNICINEQIHLMIRSKKDAQGQTYCLLSQVLTRQEYSDCSGLSLPTVDITVAKDQINSFSVDDNQIVLCIDDSHQELADSNCVIPFLKKNSKLVANDGEVRWLRYDYELESFLTQMKQNANLAVVVPEDAEQQYKAIALFGKGRVFTPKQIESLEYDDLLLFCSSPCKPQSIPKETGETISNTTLFKSNGSFMATPRAKHSLTIFYPGKASRNLISFLDFVVTPNESPIPSVISTREEWSEREHILRENGCLLHADTIQQQFCPSQSTQLPNENVALIPQQATAPGVFFNSTNRGNPAMESVDKDSTHKFS